MRELKGGTAVAVAIWCVAAALFHLWTSGFGFYEPRTQRSLHLLFVVPIAFLWFKADLKRSPADRPSAFDWVLAFLSLLPNVYSIWEANRINLRFENIDALTPGEWAMAILATVLVIEATRRAVTPVMAWLLVGGITYLFVTEHMPGLFHYRDMSLSEIVESMYLLNGMGMFGAITGISATMVSVFIIFGAFIEGSGVGRLFHNLGTRVAGQYAGGPAKVEVVSSALFGTISGSSTANVYATGSFTIPAMIKLGYRPHFAAGVETASSVGGQIMPPVMGAGAFVMAEITNIPYSQIVIAATLGSICYFTMILISVHFEAKRLGLRGVDAADMPTWRDVAADVHLLIPVFVLMGLLIVDFSPHYAAFWSIIAVAACSWLRKATRLYPRDIWRMLVAGGRNLTIVALSCASAGMFISCLTVTGVVISLSTLITSVSGGNIMIAGVMLMITTLLLGTGLPTTAAYVIGAAIGAPILIGMGVPVLAAHMFVFYFSILADATPPVSVAAYAAASIARADPMHTGITASRLAIAGFIIGFSYLYTPALLLQGPVIDIIAEFLVNMLGLTIMAAAMSGYFTGPIAMAWRLPLGALGLGIVLLETMPVWPRIGLEALIMVALHMLRGSMGGRPAPVAVGP